MSKVDKNTVNHIMEIMDGLSMKEIVYSIVNPNDNSTVAEVRLNIALTIDEKAAFVSRVVNGVFDADGDYRPWMLDPLFMITLIQMTTNVPVFTRKHTDEESGKKIDVIDVEKSYLLAKALNLGNVPNTAYKGQMDELKSMVKDQIEYRKHRNLSQERQMLSKAREELETNVAMVSAIGKQLNETLNQFGDAGAIAEAVKNTDYNRLAESVLNHS